MKSPNRKIPPKNGDGVSTSLSPRKTPMPVPMNIDYQSATMLVAVVSVEKTRSTRTGKTEPAATATNVTVPDSFIVTFTFPAPPT
jgi:hypothetical protein